MVDQKKKKWQSVVIDALFSPIITISSSSSMVNFMFLQSFYQIPVHHFALILIYVRYIWENKSP